MSDAELMLAVGFGTLTLIGLVAVVELWAEGFFKKDEDDDVHL